MKTTLKKIAIAGIILAFPLLTLAQPPHPNNGNGPGPGNTPVGGGAPIDGGLSILLALGMGYGAKKMFAKKEE